MSHPVLTTIGVLLGFVVLNALAGRTEERSFTQAATATVGGMIYTGVMFYISTVVASALLDAWLWIDGRYVHGPMAWFTMEIIR